MKVEEVGGGAKGTTCACPFDHLAQGSLHMQAADTSPRCLSVLAQAALLLLRRGGGGGGIIPMASESGESSRRAAAMGEIAGSLEIFNLEGREPLSR